MSKPITSAFVLYKGKTVGAVSWLIDKGYSVFEYDKEFRKTGPSLSPIMMPLENRESVYSFPFLDKHTFRGLPGLLSDSLPDKFGNKIIDSWLARQGRDSSSFSPVERLCYIGKRGMGALEYKPAIYSISSKSHSLEVSEIVSLINDVLEEKNKLNVKLKGKDKDIEESLKEIVRVGTSAGGARPKAIIALDPITRDVKSGQLQLPKNYEHWIIKLDGVSSGGDLNINSGEGLVEYGYYKMALKSGIKMMPCELLLENGRSHFMTKRFDREGNAKKHVQTLSALGHINFNIPGACSYEEVFSKMKALFLPYDEQKEQFRRMVFNVLARNHDDHAKNISFIMDDEGKWSLSPAYDLNYSYKEGGKWTSMHQMSLNGKRDNFNLKDLLEVGVKVGIKNSIKEIEEVKDGIFQWKKIASEIGIPKNKIKFIENNFRNIVDKG